MPDSGSIFVSYAEADGPVAKKACTVLECSGLTCWIAPRDVRPGASYPEEILRGIKGARLMLLFFSAHVHGSPWVLREVERAVSERLPILPVRLDKSALIGDFEFLLGVCQWLSADPKSPDFYDAVVQACGGSLSSINLRGPAVAPPPVPERRKYGADSDLENLDDLFSARKK